MEIYFPQIQLVEQVQPSVFVGSYNYPKVFVGPMVPPIHGNTQLMDNPENGKEKHLKKL